MNESTVNDDFVDLVWCFLEQNVNFVVVGAYASISGVSFDDATADAIEGNLGPARVRFIGRAAMKRNKLASGRPKDLLDAALLDEPPPKRG